MRFTLYPISGLALLCLVSLPAASQSYTSGVPAPFTQELYGVSPGFMGGIAFAPNGDVWVTPCVNSGGNLRRFSATSTSVVNTTTVHNIVTTINSNAGCGLSNHPDGTLYSNTTLGITNLNAGTGALIRTIGAAGNALGIAVDPTNNRLVYVGGNGSGQIRTVDPVTLDDRIFAQLAPAEAGFLDGLFFNGDGSKLYIANRSPVYRVTVVKRDTPLTGVFEKHIPLASEPDGIAFHGTTGDVFTSNTDGTISRINPLTNVVTAFASGGFRGDLAAVGSDGCWYVTQDGVRYNNGTTSPSGDSIVKICEGFLSQRGVIAGNLTPLTASNPTGTFHSVVAALVDSGGNPIAGIPITFQILSGPNAGVNGTSTTGANGKATFSYSSSTVGTDFLRATYQSGGQPVFTNSVSATWVTPAATLKCDANNDGLVNRTDLVLIQQALGQSVGASDVRDYNGNLVIDPADVAGCRTRCTKVNCVI